MGLIITLFLKVTCKESAYGGSSASDIGNTFVYWALKLGQYVGHR